MAKEVIWIKRAKDKFNKILTYLENEWSEEIANKFIERTNLIIELIDKFPELGYQIKQRKVVRRFLVTRHNYLVYRLFKNKLIIVDFVDTRRKKK